MAIEVFYWMYIAVDKLLIFFASFEIYLIIGLILQHFMHAHICIQSFCRKKSCPFIIHQLRNIFDFQALFSSISVHTHLRSADESWSRIRSATPSRPALYTNEIRFIISRVRFFLSFFQGLCFLEQRIKKVLKGQLTCRSPLRGQFCSPTLAGGPSLV